MRVIRPIRATAGFVNASRQLRLNCIPRTGAEWQGSHLIHSSGRGRNSSLRRASTASCMSTIAGMRARIDFAGGVNHVTESLQQAHAPTVLKDFLETLYECAARLAA